MLKNNKLNTRVSTAQLKKQNITSPLEASACPSLNTSPPGPLLRNHLPELYIILVMVMYVFLNNIVFSFLRLLNYK